MFWIDYTVHSGVDCFTVQGDWPGEVMGWDRDGNKNAGLKTRPLYQPGDIFVVNEDGWLIKIGNTNSVPLDKVGDIWKTTKEN